MWFRRDLRLADLPTLTSAAKPGDAAPALYVLDDALLAPSGAPRRTFLYRCLRELDAALDGLRLVAHGDPARAVPAVAKAVAAVAVHVSDFGPYGARRDEAVAKALGGANWSRPVTVRGGGGGRVTPDGTPYRVFTPFRRAWRRHGWRTPARTSAHTVTWIDPETKSWTTATNARSRCSATPPSTADRVLDRSIRLSSANARGR